MSTQSGREQFVAGLRDLADWLEETPQVPVPGNPQSVLLYLRTDEEVVRLAEAIGHTADRADHVAAFDVVFGPITYHVYGYEDFAAHLDRNQEATARDWAARHGMAIAPAADAS